MIYTCQCCGFQQEFADGEAAFKGGWDTAPHYTGLELCNLCPASLVVLKESHASVHARWEVEGRPPTFTQESCLEPEYRVPQAELDAMKLILDRIQAAREANS